MNPKAHGERVLHPYFFALFPIISFYAHNYEQMSNAELATILFAPIMAALTAGLSFILRRPIGNKRKRGLVISLFWMSIFTLPHMTSIAEWFWPGRHLDLILPALLLLVLLPLLSFAVARSRRDFTAATTFLNWTGFFALLLPALILGYKLFFRGLLHAAPAQAAVASPEKRRPDIFYIVLDGYARSDILREIYNYDNGPFLDFLRRKGFYVAEKSTANYNHTQLSLAASLNMTYLDSLAAGLKNFRKEMGKLLNKTAVISALSGYGYRTVSFPTGFSLTDIENVDIFLEPKGNRSEFQEALLELTPLGKLDELVTKKSRGEKRKDRLLYIFDNLPRVRRLVPEREPLFVMAHILSPHPSFVLATSTDNPEEDGSRWHRRDKDKIAEYIRRYRDEIEIVNRKLTDMLDKLMTNEPEAVIILQADHGPGSGLDWESLKLTNLKERMSILNAYYFPDQDYEVLQPDISPVNSFRIVFNKYFGTDYELLPNRNFFSVFSSPGDFKEVTKKVDTAAVK